MKEAQICCSLFHADVKSCVGCAQRGTACLWARVHYMIHVSVFVCTRLHVWHVRRRGMFCFFSSCVCVCWCETVYAALLRAFAITDCQKEKDFREVSFSLFKVGALWDMFGILIHSLKMACDLKPLTGSACSVSVSRSLSLPFSFPLAL